MAASTPPPGWLPPQHAMPLAPGPVDHDGAKLDGRRLAAVVLDLICIGLISLGLRWLCGASPWTALGALVVLFAWFGLFELAMGTTPGKRLAGLRVVGTDGRHPSAGAVGLRTLLRIVDHLWLVAAITMLATGRRRQRVGDLAADTVVVLASDAPPGRPRGGASIARRAALLVVLPLAVMLAMAALGWLPGSYQATATRICRQSGWYLATQSPSPNQTLEMMRWRASHLAALQPPAHRREDHRYLVASAQSLHDRYEAVLQQAAASRDWAEAYQRGVRPLNRDMRAAEADMEAHGYPACG